ncbi:MAG: flagellar protein FlaG [Deltaproteobacteria bacterium]
MKVDSIAVNPMPSKVETAQPKENVENKIEKSSSLENKKVSEINQAEKNTMPISEKVIIEAIEKANKAIEGARTEFKFSIHDKTHEISVKVLDKDSGEVIREIPPEKVLDMVARMWEMAGIIVDEKR